MRVLWVINGLLPEATAKLKGQKELKDSGGWVMSLANELSLQDGIIVSVVGITNLVTKLTVVNGERIIYYAIPPIGQGTQYHKEYEVFFREVCNLVRPDVVHIHGTEYPHSLAALRACGADKTVISIQGLVSEIAPLYYGGIKKIELIRNMTIHDIIRGTLFQQKNDMLRRGEYEKDLLNEAKYVIGRTTWDKSHTWLMNSRIQYFYCDEMLRPEFLEGGKWNYDNCAPYSIFTSQGYYPIKGLHKIIEALRIVKLHYNDVSLRVAGQDFTFGKSIKNNIRLSAYGKYVKGIIKKYNLEDNISFVGRLNAKEMINEYLHCNVFCCPSIIENSPNSLCEAQILGVPCLASYAGGIPDIMRGDESHLYRYEDTGMLASAICNLFEQRGTIDTSKMRRLALDRHNTKTILDKLINIYRSVVHA